MAYRRASRATQSTVDNCPICLSALDTDSVPLTLLCNHTYHFHCLVASVRAQIRFCPLCRVPIDPSTIDLVSDSVEVPASDQYVDRYSVDYAPLPGTPANPLRLAVSTKLEYGGQAAHTSSTMYGMVSLYANTSGTTGSTVPSRVPIDLICVVDQSASMSGGKMILLKETLVYITEQLTESDRLAIVSFDNHAYDRSHGLKPMTQRNKHKFTETINNDIEDGMSTYIGCGLEMAINMFTRRQTANPVSALFLLTDGQDDEVHDYSALMNRLPNDIVCHTFGYGSDHATRLLVRLAELGHRGTYTHIDKTEAVGPAFAMALAGLLTCVAQNISVHVQLNGEYRITDVHSIYPHEPQRLPSPRVTFKLHDLNAEEKRHLVFQLHAPAVHETPSQNHSIGQVVIKYTDPNSGQAWQTVPLLFHLNRSSQLSPADRQVSRSIDVQRNRIETARVVRQAMDEQHYHRSQILLKAQADRIRASASAQHPFCQQLIRDLEQRYSTEHDYRSTNQNLYMQHATERGTYSAGGSSSAHVYGSIHQLRQRADYQRRYQ